MNRKTTAIFFVVCAVLVTLHACGSNTVNNGPTDDQVEASPDVRVTDKQDSGRQETDNLDAPDRDEISQRYRQNADDYDKLAFQLELDPEITELYCDKNMVVVTTRDETFYDGEDDPYTARYAQLCRFTWKVAAHRSSNGIRFPHRFFEVGSKMVGSYLEKRTNLAEDNDACRSPLFDGERGKCAITIDGDWSASYEWNPFCLEHMKGEVGC